MFYSENINHAYCFYVTEMYVNVCRGVFRTQQIIYDAAFLRKLQKGLIVDVRRGSKYPSGISFIGGKGLQNVNICLK